jgi:hypothetical protein
MGLTNWPGAGGIRKKLIHPTSRKNATKAPAGAPWSQAKAFEPCAASAHPLWNEIEILKAFHNFIAAKQQRTEECVALVHDFLIERHHLFICDTRQLFPRNLTVTANYLYSEKSPVADEGDVPVSESSDFVETAQGISIHGEASWAASIITSKTNPGCCGRFRGLLAPVVIKTGKETWRTPIIFALLFA